MSYEIEINIWGHLAGTHDLYDFLIKAHRNGFAPWGHYPLVSSKDQISAALIPRSMVEIAVDAKQNVSFDDGGEISIPGFCLATELYADDYAKDHTWPDFVDKIELMGLHYRASTQVKDLDDRSATLFRFVDKPGNYVELKSWRDAGCDEALVLTAKEILALADKGHSAHAIGYMLEHRKIYGNPPLTLSPSVATEVAKLSTIPVDDLHAWLEDSPLRFDGGFEKIRQMQAEHNRQTR